MTTYNDYSVELSSYLSTLHKHGFTVLTCSNDGGETIAATFSKVSFNEFVEECMGADECHLSCRSPLGKQITIYFVYGNSCGEIACDYTYTAELDPVNAEHADLWDGKDVPTKPLAVKYIDLTPTWEALMPALIAAAANGSTAAIEELTRLARTVDNQNAKLKGAK